MYNACTCCVVADWADILHKMCLWGAKQASSDTIKILWVMAADAEIEYCNHCFQQTLNIEPLYQKEYSQTVKKTVFTGHDLDV